MRVLVTGAAGFIGSSVAEALVRRGDDVVGVDNFNDFYDPAIKEANARDVAATAEGAEGRFRLVRADLVTDGEVIEGLFRDAGTRPDVVLHLAAWAGVRPSIKKPLVYTANNVEATTKLLELARIYEVRPFVFASSSSVYGARKTVPFREDDRVDDPISPYAATKKAGELIGYTYHHLHGIRFLRCAFLRCTGRASAPRWPSICLPSGFWMVSPSACTGTVHPAGTTRTSKISWPGWWGRSIAVRATPSTRSTIWVGRETTACAT